MSIVNYSGKQYVTYTNKSNFDPNKIINNKKDIITYLQSKPSGGFWGSPVNAFYGWKDWCIDNEFGDYDFNNPIYWYLKNNTKIFEVGYDDVTDISESNPLLQFIYNKKSQKYVSDVLIENPELTSTSFGKVWRDICIDFNKMKSAGIDAIELMDAGIGHYFINAIEVMFNSWDCESIVVINPEKIIFV